MGLACPVVVEELSVCSRVVRTRGQLRGARVDFLVDGLAGVVGGGTADWPDQWFSLNAGVTLKPGQILRTQQSLNGQNSPVSKVGATVQDRSASRPYFLGPLVACSGIAVLGGLAPGATATV